MKLTTQQTKLLDFVKEKHFSQKRKYTGEPYWYHLLAVANTTDGLAPFAIEISLCHDLFEDTSTSYNELDKFLLEIGYLPDESIYICDGVMALTDLYTKDAYPDFNRAKRKALEATRLGSIKPDYQTIKYGDLIDNTSSIVDNDPNFAKTYLKEKREILSKMKSGNQTLYKQALSQIN